MVRTIDGGVVFFCQCENLIGFVAARFKMCRVDETASRRGLERDFEHIQFGGVDHQRNIHAHLEFLDDLAHQFDFVGAFGDGAGNVQGVRAEFDLFARDLEDASRNLLRAGAA